MKSDASSMLVKQAAPRVVVYARPPQAIQDAIADYRVAHPLSGKMSSTLGLHCTIWGGGVVSERLDAVQKAFLELELPRASTRTGSLARFDPAELVVKLHRYPRILKLHSIVAECMTPFAEDASDQAIYASWPEYARWKNEPARWDAARKYGRPYFGSYFNPHISIGKTNGFVEGHRELYGLMFPIDEVVLAIRYGKGLWEELATKRLQ